MSAGIREIYDPIRGSHHVDWGIDHLCKHMDAGEVDLDPAYQRSHVWTKDQQMDYLGFMLEGGKPPEIFVRELVQTDSIKPPYYEMVDGKQRVTAMYKWWRHEIPARLSPEFDSRLIWAKDLDEVEVRSVKMDVRVSVQILQTDLAGTIRMYLRLNTGGTPHTKEEIERVRKLYREVAT